MVFFFDDDRSDVTVIQETPPMNAQKVGGILGQLAGQMTGQITGKYHYYNTVRDQAGV